MVLIASATGAIGGLVALWRWRKIRDDPVGMGYNAASPGGQYRVFATTMSQRFFWGGRRAFYRFEIIDITADTQVAFEEIPIPDGAPAMELVESNILFLPEASRVRIVCEGIEVWRRELK